MRNTGIKRIAMLMLLLTATFIISVASRRAEARPQAAGSARQVAEQVAIDPDDIGGVVTSSKGPEAGVWVIAETTELPTKFRKIVVTDERGRYLLPQLPKATYKVWVRGYGLIDSGAVSATPGEHLALTAVIAPDAKAAAQYYPANYWLSLLRVPPKSAFPMTVSVPSDKLSYSRGPGSMQAHDPVGDGPMQKGVVETQANWVATIKNCASCHQMGTRITREIPPALGTFGSSTEAWDQRIRMGQIGSSMVGMLNPLGIADAEKVLADWSDRIAQGEIPPAPPRPAMKTTGSPDPVSS